MRLHAPITLHLLTYGDTVRLVIGLVTAGHPAKAIKRTKVEKYSRTTFCIVYR